MFRRTDPDDDRRQRLTPKSEPQRRLRTGPGQRPNGAAPRPHPRLLRYVEDLRDALRRYELAYLQDQEDMELSIEEHGAIAAAYERGDRAEALELLRRHWHRGKDELLAVLPEEDRS